MNITRLKGYSGCHVLLCEENGHKPFIRKVSGSIEYNERLHNQMSKQRNFHSNRGLKAPEVYGEGYQEDGLYYFDMQYIQGITLSEYMKRIDIGKIRGIVKGLVRSVECYGEKNPHANSIFNEKVRDVRSKILGISNTALEAVSILEDHYWGNYETCCCHGDMTLENIMVKNEQLYVIDFLDSFYECGILDIATLLQDVLVMWSYRNISLDENTLIRLIIFKDILLETIKETLRTSYMEVYYALLLKLVRIYPYTDDISTIDFLDSKVRMIMDTIGE